MRMGQGVRIGLGHGGITCVLQTQFSSFILFSVLFIHLQHLHLAAHPIETLPFSQDLERT